jgi:hypothetical protein
MKRKVKKARLNIQKLVSIMFFVNGSSGITALEAARREAQATAPADHPLKRRPQKIRGLDM